MCQWHVLMQVADGESQQCKSFEQVKVGQTVDVSAVCIPPLPRRLGAKVTHAICDQDGQVDDVLASIFDLDKVSVLPKCLTRGNSQPKHGTKSGRHSPSIRATPSHGSHRAHLYGALS
jgi:hypothetical protein